VTSTISVGRLPHSVGVDPSTDTVYVGNETDDTVSVIDGATDTVTSTIPVGNDPYGVGVDPSTRTIYVTNFQGNTVSVIDGATDAVTSTIPWATTRGAWASTPPPTPSSWPTVATAPSLSSTGPQML